MALKSAYRKKPAEPHIPEAAVDGVEAEPVTAVSAEAAPDVEPADAVVEAMAAATKADAAKYALLQQVEALRQSEAMHKAATMTPHAHPMTREQKLDLWMQQGMPAEERAFFEANPELIDHPQLTAAAAHEALQHHERGSAAHREETKRIFHHHLERLKAQGAAQSPQFFRPPEPPPHSMPSPASFTSAPVSREAPTGSSREPSPSQVRLSADELAIAAGSKISPTEYARNKLRLQREKRAGQRH